MNRLNLIDRIYGVKSSFYGAVDIRTIWEIIDSFPEEESLIIHKMYDMQGRRLDITRDEIVKEIGMSGGVRRLEMFLSRSFTKLRHPRNRHRYEFKEELSEIQGIQLSTKEKIVDYKLIHAASDLTYEAREILERDIKMLLNRGYQPFGNPVIHILENFKLKYSYAQAMVKYEEI